MQGSGQPHGGAASSALRTPLLLAELFLGRSRLTFLPKGASAARHHPSACQQHGLERYSELGRERGSHAMAWQSSCVGKFSACQCPMPLGQPWGLLPGPWCQSNKSAA